MDFAVALVTDHFKDCRGGTVDHTNVASLKGCEKAGFAPYVERRESWFPFRRRVQFLPLGNVTAVPTHSTRI